MESGKRETSCIRIFAQALKAILFGDESEDGRFALDQKETATWRLDIRRSSSCTGTQNSQLVDSS